MPKIVSIPDVIPWESTQAKFLADNVCDFHFQTEVIFSLYGQASGCSHN